MDWSSYHGFFIFDGKRIQLNCDYFLIYVLFIESDIKSINPSIFNTEGAGRLPIDKNPKT